MTSYSMCINLRDVVFRKSPNYSGDLPLSNLMQKSTQCSQSSIVTHSNFTHFKLRYRYLLFPFKFVFLSIGFTVVIPLVSCFRAKNQATSIESSWRIYQSSLWNALVAGLFWQPCLKSFMVLFDSLATSFLKDLLGFPGVNVRSLSCTSSSDVNTSIVVMLFELQVWFL